MRWRATVVFSLLAAYIALGCREPLRPNIDRNQAPETWITAAPFDTITIRDRNGNPIDQPRPGTIPIRFHVYWAGADKDGVVNGFYWAVVETLPRDPLGGPNPPPLPGPKPQDYRFTTRTDSTFIFRVAEDIPDRQHAFFIYAVDNQGKPDPTPARFIFTAQDRFPPIPVFDDCHCTGIEYRLLPGGGVAGSTRRIPLTNPDVRNVPPADTCLSGSTLFFSWHAESPLPGNEITGYAYKLDEPNLIEVGPDVRSTTYFTKVGSDTIPPTPGTKIFLLKARDQANGTARATRRFQYNFSPDSWLSGPDPASPSLRTTERGERFTNLLPGGHLPPEGIAGSLLSRDSTQVFPALRGTFRTFFEIWKDTVFVRQEGDTVHLNSWVLFHAGGFDRDSPYEVLVSSLGRSLPEFPGGPILDGGAANGSPVAFRSQVVMSLSPTNDESRTPISGTYPIFDPNNVFNAPYIGGYHPMTQAGRAFAYAFAVDGDGAQDRRIDNLPNPGPRALVLRNESGQASAYERSLRPKVISYYVGRLPYFLTDRPGFRPRTNGVETFDTWIWNLSLPAADEDPPPEGISPGGPGGVLRLRRRLELHGTRPDGSLYVHVDPTPYLDEEDITLNVPCDFPPGPAFLRVELCDCHSCELFPGSGRCRTLDIPVLFQPAGPCQPTQNR